MTRYTQVPVHMRGTVHFGDHKPHHFQLDKYGQLMAVSGQDPRDWDAIDQGALDYTRIAAQEHMVEPFQGHDGPRIAAACHLCAGGEGSGEDLITRKTRALIEAKKGGLQPQTADDTLPRSPVSVTGPVPDVPDPITVAEQAQRRAEAEAAELRARLDKQDKAALTPPDNSADLSPAPMGSTETIGVATFTPTPDGQPTMGTDPWTQEQVPVTRMPGADTEAPYGRKADGSPRKPAGRGPHPSRDE